MQYREEKELSAVVFFDKDESECMAVVSEPIVGEPRISMDSVQSRISIRLPGESDPLWIKIPKELSGRIKTAFLVQCDASGKPQREFDVRMEGV